MSSDVRKAVEHWKTRTLHAGDIPFDKAALSAGKPRQMFQVKQVGEVEWVIWNSREDKPASLSYAAIVSLADPMETGNLVIDTEKRPEGLPADRVERWASYKCSYTYVFDTSRDQGLYTLQGALDKYIATVPGFETPDRRPRRVWQSSSNLPGRAQFWMRAPMFIRVRDGEEKDEAPDTVHEWVKVAESRSRWYRANPTPPKVYELVEGVLVPIRQCDPPTLIRGDAVAISFSMSYIVGRRDWYPTYSLTHLVRVAKAVTVDQSSLSEEHGDRSDEERVDAERSKQKRGISAVVDDSSNEERVGHRKRSRDILQEHTVELPDEEVQIEWPASDEERERSTSARGYTDAGSSDFPAGGSGGHDDGLISSYIEVDGKPTVPVPVQGSPKESSSSDSSFSTISGGWSDDSNAISFGVAPEVEKVHGDDGGVDLKGKGRGEGTGRRRTRTTRQG